MTQLATFAAGCFWGVEELYRKLPGVLQTTVGYTGGTTENPTYEQVCSGNTGHAEAVQIEYDPDLVSYDALLDIFWQNHNPTTLNSQGPDFGSQYRSAVFYHDEQQRVAAEHSKLELQGSGKWGTRPIVTEIVEAKPFYSAEEYHQQYLAKNNLRGCHM